MSNRNGHRIHPPFRGVDWNDHDSLEQLEEARQLLFVGQVRVDRWIREYAVDYLFSLDMVQGIHRVLFEDVWPEFAGRLRGPTPLYIARNVNFGGKFPSVHFEDVLSHLQGLVNRTNEKLRDLDSRVGHLSIDIVDEYSCRIAAALHCDLVRIHPFVNGNGRMARSCINFVGQRYGMKFVRFDSIPRNDYLNATEAYMAARDWSEFAGLLRSHWQRSPRGT